jgi:plasmid stability protein
MSITISLAPETEEKLQKRAAEMGVTPDALARQLLEQALSGAPGAALGEILAPFRKEVEESGLTDEQLKDFFTEVRDDMRAEKRARQARG